MYFYMVHSVHVHSCWSFTLQWPSLRCRIECMMENDLLIFQSLSTKHLQSRLNRKRKTECKPSVCWPGPQGGLSHWWSPEWRASGVSCVWLWRSCTRWGAACCSRPPGTCCHRHQRWDLGGRRGAPEYWCSTHSARNTTSCYEQPVLWCNVRSHCCGWHLDNVPSTVAYAHAGNKLCSKWDLLLACLWVRKQHWFRWFTYTKYAYLFRYPDWMEEKERQGNTQKSSLLLIQEGGEKNNGAFSERIFSNYFFKGSFLVI